ncbi:lipase family protein [Litorimonas sp. WD9-15]|uniref:lipase family protein n=1 Tax=Litorimonas sp. WD9-15 TaxID=3418716 RepID=UPI003CFBEBC9
MNSYDTTLEAGAAGSFYTLALKLATIAYEQPSKIVTDVPGETNGNLQVVWGPVLDQSILSGQYSCMYITLDKTTGVHHLVIRGTHRDSLFSWLFEDFSVGETKPFFSLPGLTVGRRAEASLGDIMISKGTWRGMTYILNMRSWMSKVGLYMTALEYLAHIKAKSVIVCGHSLGGTLTPPMYLYLNYLLNVIGKRNCSLGLVSFAGLPPGGQKFATYFNQIFQNAYPWRIRNTLDIAPLMWLNLETVLNIYQSNNLSLSYVDPVRGLLDAYFWEADDSGITYTQPTRAVDLPGVFDTRWREDHFWAAQAAHQHGTDTYKALLG